MDMRRYETSASTTIGGVTVPYRTVCGDFPVHAADGSVLGTVFSYSYIRSDVTEPGNRPVLFAFNGGPGSSSIWLHTGLLAPRTVKMDDPLHPPTVPPYALEENEDCLLDVCDLVLVDPMGTGYSRVFDPARQAEVYSVEEDARVFADFICDWKLRENRWNSPTYLLAESYGTMRAAVIPTMLAGGPLTALHETRGQTLSGIILMGNTVAFQPGQLPLFEGNVEPMVLNFPTMAATNWYYTTGAKPPLAEYMRAAYAFAQKTLLPALFAGHSLDAAASEQVLDELAGFTGLDKALLRRKNLRIDPAAFARERLAAQGLDIGLYDSRFTMAHSEHLGDIPEPTADDPAMGAYTPAYCGAFAEIARGLGINTETPYTAINFKVNGAWSYAGQKQPGEHLQAALRRNPSLRLLFCCGYYDFVTTCGQARYLANHLDAAPGQILLKEYASGHMPYIGESRAELARDLRAMVTGAAL